MRLTDYRVVANWTESDLLNILKEETDYYEYKSSQIVANPKWSAELQQKICNAASAFWNTGGGVFIVGVDDKGQIDGGIPSTVGKQPIRAWVDQVLRDVQPIGPYEVGVIQSSTLSSLIQPNKIVLVIAFGESFNLPHMSSDKKHYARLGVHTEPAPYYLVEAIRARRGLRKPLLKGLLRRHERKSGVIELVVLNVNQEPALNVSVMFNPLPQFLAEHSSQGLPFVIPIIDNKYPFRMDITTFNAISAWFGETPIHLLLEYEDVVGNKYNEIQILDPYRSVSAFGLKSTPSDAPEKLLGKIADEIKKIREILGKIKK